MFVCGTIELNERRRHLKIHGHTKINDTSMYRVSYDPTKKWKATGFQIEFGKIYHIEAKAVPDAQGRPYSDKGLRSTPDGASTLVGRLFDWLARDARSPLNPVGLIRHDRVKRLRVLTDRFGKKAHFLTVIGCIGQPAEADLERYAFVIGSSCDLVGYANGELFAFSNDWPGDDSLPKEEQPYLNNTGTIELSVEER
jgi:hypothetical protein